MSFEVDCDWFIRSGCVPLIGRSNLISGSISVIGDFSGVNLQNVPSFFQLVGYQATAVNDKILTSTLQGWLYVQIAGLWTGENMLSLGNEMKKNVT